MLKLKMTEELKKALIERAAQMHKMRTEGGTLQEIGDKFDLTRERVRQILNKYHPKN